MSNIQIFVPTYGRTEHTIAPLTSLKNVTLVVRPDEAPHYIKFSGFKLKILPSHIKTIGQTRHWIIEQATAKYVWMVDDDVTTKTLQAGIEAVTAEMRRVKASLGCVGPAYMAQARQNKDGAFTYNRFGNAAWCVEKKAYFKSNTDMRQFATSEDMYCYLNMLSQGYKSVLSNIHIVRKREGQSGGCAMYRNEKTVLRDMRKLEKIYAPHYRIVESNFKSQGYRLGVSARVAWSKLGP